MPLLTDRLPGGFPTFDRLVLALLIPAQLILAMLMILPGLARELLPENRWNALLWQLGEDLGSVSGLLARWPAWVLLSLLLATLLLEMRKNVGARHLFRLALLGLTVPILAAGFGAESRSAASALRWAMAIAFLSFSVPLWLRDRLAAWAERTAWQHEEIGWAVPWLRRFLVASLAVPVLVLTVYPAIERLFGQVAQGPGEGSLFLAMGPRHATVWPVLLVCAGLVVHALVERLPGYAFLVGLGGNLVASLLIRSFHRTDHSIADWWLPLLQANASAFSATALLWLSARHRLYGERGSGSLLLLQIGLGIVSCGVLILTGLIGLVIDPSSVPELVKQTGDGWSWLTLGLTGASLVWFSLVRQRSLVHVLVGLFLSAGVLLAAGTTLLSDSSLLAYYILLATWTLLAVGLLTAGWRNSLQTRPESEPLHGWVLIVAGCVLILALRSMWMDQTGAIWSYVLLGCSAGLAVALALWRKVEGWILLAGLLIHLIVSHALFPVALATELPGLTLCQINLLVVAGVSLLWLALAPLVYGQRRPGIVAAPLLTLQLGVGFLGQLCLLLLAAFWLVVSPERPPALLAGIGSRLGWIALVSAAVPIVWYVRLSLSASLPLLTLLGVFGSVLAGATASTWDDGRWLAFHILRRWSCVHDTGSLCGSSAGCCASCCESLGKRNRNF